MITGHENVRTVTTCGRRGHRRMDCESWFSFGLWYGSHYARQDTTWIMSLLLLLALQHVQDSKSHRAAPASQVLEHGTAKLWRRPDMKRRCVARAAGTYLGLAKKRQPWRWKDPCTEPAILEILRPRSREATQLAISRCAREKQRLPMALQSP